MPLIRKGGAAPPPSSGDGAEQALKALRTGAPDERWTAARALAADPAAAALLGEALAVERDPRVREALLTGLARIGTAQSVEAITPLLRSDDASVRTGALDALRLMPGALASHLSGLLSDPDADVRVLACDLARQLPAPLATRLLCEVLAREPEVNVCAAAIDVLAECGGPEAVDALSACADRFADQPFLVFASRIAAQRLRAQAPGADG